MTCYCEIIRQGYVDLFDCIYERHGVLYSKKRDMNERGSFGLIHLAAGQKDSAILKYLLEKDESAS